MDGVGEHQKNGERVKINVGGTVFETTVSTLTRLDNTVLSTMVAERWRNQEELFVDRSPTYFSKVLDYLRDGENVTLPKEDEAREAIRKEADFYNLPGLAKMCVSYASVSKVDKGFRLLYNKKDLVQWNESVAEQYWKYLVRYLYTLEYPSSEMKKLRCMACGTLTASYIGPTASLSNIDIDKTGINYEDWIPLKRHMSYMVGVVVGKVDHSCYEVKWGSELLVHIPVSALRLYGPK